MLDQKNYSRLNADLKRQENYVITEAVNMAAIGGGIGLVGLYMHVPVSKGTPRADLTLATITFPISTFFSKNLSIKGGIEDVLGLNPTLLQLVNSGRAKPGFVVTGEVGIEEAPEAYRRFDQKLEERSLFAFPGRVLSPRSLWRDLELSRVRQQSMASKLFSSAGFSCIAISM
ncbi:hypothetical protein F4820DRAFT_440013 [Hypoxylon rubiginosum]|uniref:Uncharacterized protein n=1 Tax=Hypoxylon rubiginosum TaxID=110542 RepID=A0ACB9YIX9_9PEZI|nr:hypothetical protein F4820DRAFT_440013 [Hypoxylon rubiginosum]